MEIFANTIRDILLYTTDVEGASFALRTRPLYRILMTQIRVFMHVSPLLLQTLHPVITALLQIGIMVV